MPIAPPTQIEKGAVSEDHGAEGEHAGELRRDARERLPRARAGR